MSRRLILASGSAIRAQILTSAGVDFTIVRPPVDEAAIKKKALRAGRTLREIAQMLADAKSCAIDAEPDAYVLGADQILAFEGRGYDKPTTIEDAKARLAMLQGRPHTLINAVSIARAGNVVFRHLDEPALHMREMSAAEIDAYLLAAGKDILSSVGAYQAEALGSRLFERIEGDYFAVLGLALHPVLGYLRREKVLAF